MSYTGIETNKKFLITGAVIVGAIVLIYFAASYDSDSQPAKTASTATKNGELKARPGDADTIANSIENILVITQELKQQNKIYAEEIEKINTKINASDQGLSELANSQRQTNQALVGEVEKMINSKSQLRPQDVNLNEYPVVSEPTPIQSSWVQPIESVIYNSHPTESNKSKADQSVITSFTDKLGALGDSIVSPTAQKVKTVKDAVFSDSPLEHKDTKPVYTIPKNATIFNSYLATSLVGRLPSNNQLSNPYRFKILTGPEGIASNSIELPEELSAMTFSGTAVGDWGLSCASGKIDSVTFTFNDGEIVTIDGKGSKGIGWISDEYGEPCIKGTKVSDSKSVLTKRILAGALTSGADTYARAQTDTVLTGTGAVIDIEDANKYASYNAISGGARELERHLDRRLDQIFEAVYVPNGAKVMIHIEYALEIDRDKSNRKVRYDEKVQVSNID